MFAQYQCIVPSLGRGFSCSNSVYGCAVVFLGPNQASGWVADFQGRILVTVPNGFSESSFIIPVCAHAAFERSSDKE